MSLVWSMIYIILGSGFLFTNMHSTFRNKDNTINTTYVVNLSIALVFYVASFCTGD